MRQQCAYIGILKTLTFQNKKEEEITDIKMLLAEFMESINLILCPFISPQFTSVTFYMI